MRALLLLVAHIAHLDERLHAAQALDDVLHLGVEPQTRGDAGPDDHAMPKKGEQPDRLHDEIGVEITLAHPGVADVTSAGQGVHGRGRRGGGPSPLPSSLPLQGRDRRKSNVSKSGRKRMWGKGEEEGG